MDSHNILSLLGLALRGGNLAVGEEPVDAVARARQLKGNQVTWQAVVERLLLSLMEEKSKWST